MEPRISLITLGVDDIGRAKTFYEALGWRGQEVEATVFFQAGGSVLVLWGRDQLAADAKVDDTARGAFDGVALAHNVRTHDEVDAILAVAAAAGAIITSPAGPTSYGGYAGYFADPDGHCWEIAFNPHLPLDDAGNLVLPQMS